MSKRIKIKTVNPNGQGSDGTALVDYFFEAFGAGYNLYSPTSATPVNHQVLTSTNPSCTFHVHGHHNPFTVTITQFPNETILGTWSDLPQAESDRDVPGSGTFQAQAGGSGTSEDEVAAASA